MFGLFTENGPFTVTPNLTLKPSAYPWNCDFNLIYFDNPVGTGFSFTDSDAGYSTNEEEVGRNMLNAMHQFMACFPHLQSNSFYVAGESYAGKYVPALGYAIYRDNQRVDFHRHRTKPKINLKGLLEME